MSHLFPGPRLACSQFDVPRYEFVTPWSKDTQENTLHTSEDAAAHSKVKF